MTLATFYRDFPSKQDLILAYLQSVHDDFEDRATVAEQAAETPGDVLTSIGNNITAQLTDPGFRGFASSTPPRSSRTQTARSCAPSSPTAPGLRARPRRVRDRRPPPPRRRRQPLRDASRRSNDSRTSRLPFRSPRHLRPRVANRCRSPTTPPRPTTPRQIPRTPRPPERQPRPDPSHSQTPNDDATPDQAAAPAQVHLIRPRAWRSSAPGTSHVTLPVERFGCHSRLL